jgi:hypothetical protein
MKDLCSECSRVKEIRTYHLVDETFFYCQKCAPENLAPCEECEQLQESEGA